MLARSCLALSKSAATGGQSPQVVLQTMVGSEEPAFDDLRNF